jgi:hypothetical protein
MRQLTDVYAKDLIVKHHVAVEDWSSEGEILRSALSIAQTYALNDGL